MGTTLLRVCLVFAVTLLTTCLAPSTALAKAVTYNTKGDFADADLRVGTAACWLYVGRDESSGAGQTYLWYSCYSADSGELVASGDGPIPSEHFTVSGNSRRLNTDTSKIAGFNQWAGPGGRITLTWTKDGVYTRTETGTVRVHAPSSTFRFKGTWTYIQATVKGTMLAAPIDGFGATVGTNKLSTVTVEHP